MQVASLETKPQNLNGYYQKSKHGKNQFKNSQLQQNYIHSQHTPHSPIVSNHNGTIYIVLHPTFPNTYNHLKTKSTTTSYQIFFPSKKLTQHSKHSSLYPSNLEDSIYITLQKSLTLLISHQHQQLHILLIYFKKTKKQTSLFTQNVSLKQKTNQKPITRMLVNKSSTT